MTFLLIFAISTRTLTNILVDGGQAWVFLFGRISNDRELSQAMLHSTILSLVANVLTILLVLLAIAYSDIAGMTTWNARACSSHYPNLEAEGAAQGYKICTAVGINNRVYWSATSLALYQLVLEIVTLLQHFFGRERSAHERQLRRNKLQRFAEYSRKKVRQVLDGELREKED
ncbi:hypothetical protein Slin14017_G001160 [Septoria linicola]|nr:hypothetical protein Slin14017_G001160 [Septoria linicola]